MGVFAGGNSEREAHAGVNCMPPPKSSYRVPAKEFAEIQRWRMTPSEKLMWLYLRKVGFRSQFTIGPYTVDFANVRRRVAVEIDGGYHYEGSQPAKDAAKDKWLNAQGWQVMRFGNWTVGHDAQKCSLIIREAAKKRPDFGAL
jgi:guanylate kinase